MHRRTALALTFSGIAALGVPAAVARAGIDRTRLPVGSVSTSAERNRLWSCRTSFDANAPGASAQGPWFNGDGTWDMTRKVAVSGSVTWPNANLRVSVSGATRTITGNALPIGVATGRFPVAASDAAFSYDRNPNSIRSQTVSLQLPARPRAATPQCVAEVVGISLAGPPILSAIDAGGRDAQAWEIQDRCSGHPQEVGMYHFHGFSGCGRRNAQFGWALDGFPIWGPVDPVTGKEWTNDDLDECHGTTSTLLIDGSRVTTYHYVANDQYPYTVGCFRAKPAALRGAGAAPARPSGAGRPPGTPKA